MWHLMPPDSLVQRQRQFNQPLTLSVQKGVLFIAFMLPCNFFKGVHAKLHITAKWAINVMVVVAIKLDFVTVGGRQY